MHKYMHMRALYLLALLVATKHRTLLTVLTHMHVCIYICICIYIHIFVKIYLYAYMCIAVACHHCREKK